MIFIPSVKDKIYGVMGLGISGTAAARALQASGAQVWAWDDSELNRLQAQSQGINVRIIPDHMWPKVEALVLNPGIPHHFPEPHPYAIKAREANLPIVCDINFLPQAQPQAQFIGITGTNGKSTTTALIGHLLKTAGYPCQVGGNIGISALALDPFSDAGTYVLELSSYQLELIPDLFLDRALLLNIAPDHLARHGGMTGYIEAKQKIFHRLDQRPQALAIIGIDDSFCEAVYHKVKKKYSVISISSTKPADIYAAQGILYEEGTPVLDVGRETKLPGVHNAQNIAAAYALGRSLTLTKQDLIRGLKTFQGLPHRLECLGTIDNVQFINDSKATNAEAVAKALACYEDIYWILGGQAKENGLEGLEPYYSRIQKAFLIGEAAPLFYDVLKNQFPLEICHTLDKAVASAFQAARQHQIARSGKKPSVILLSPACASWDQFKNFEHRGDCFRDLFHKLKKTSLSKVAL